jgi:hypothetical protein
MALAFGAGLGRSLAIRPRHHPPFVSRSRFAASYDPGVIARAVRLAQATSSTTSVLVLIAFNLVPLVGVLVGRWNVATLLVLYWVENGVIGVLNVPKVLLAEGPTRTGIGSALALVPASRGLIAAFFLVHYGVFWVVHGIFVWTLPLFASLGSATATLFDGPGAVDAPLGGFGGFGPFAPFGAAAGTGVDGSAVVWGAIGLAISHGVSFVLNYLGRGEYRKVSPQEQAQQPYSRLIVLHLAIIFGGFVSLMMGSPLGSILVLVLLKTALDVRFHRREHDRLAARPATG